MEFFLVLFIAILVLRPEDVQKLARFLGKIFSLKKHAQKKWQDFLTGLETKENRPHE